MPLLAHRIKLKPDPAAERYMRRAAGIARFAYNWALARNQEEYEATGKSDYSGRAMRAAWNAHRKAELPWTYDVSNVVGHQAILDLGEAFKRFFKGVSKHPKFKKKGRSRASFFLDNPRIKVSGRYLKVPRLDKPIKMCESVRFKGEIRSVTISREADEWFASFLVKIPDETFVYAHAVGDSQAAAGIDLGLTTLMTLSDGTKFENPRTLKKNLRKVRKLSKSVSRKVKGSANRRKAAVRLARGHAKVARIRKDHIHKITSKLVRTFKFIGIENLNVSGMTKNRRLARSLQDAAFYEIRRQLEYKAKLAGGHVVLADRWMPSSKACSSDGCDHVLEKLALDQRRWTCPACGAAHDRDVNAAKNLMMVALRYRETLNACGENVRLNVPSGDGGRFSVKQESIIFNPIELG